ncbi:proline--tRNA ligase [Caldisericum exile]|uniref:Proline--tRNA ligase n=1 Tax=Caldisericum exile (strain DSM 21853 / NBRC 104410 / AZM16c01) TaxID=511051 RepID=A0A7U6GEI6_CALEA|nr:proline--tRNA ligase [Caldisericum exile]BAL80923.1 prolyl-tRNA synthetase [Caldisericum exile AZM16c01]
MRIKDFFLPTLREDPQDAEIESHKLMIKAGLIRKMAAGVYSYLPFGYIALKNVEKIIREEMNNAGALELLFPAIMPKELWDETGRWEIYGDEMFKLKDRKGRFFCLGPTHEEAVVDLARKELRSYKDLPKIFYQIQTKYRDEIRPRFGLMRAREFLMKDAYSFDTSEENLEISYKKMYDAYIKIFKRCHLDVIPIEADSGAIGGKVSHEFVVISELGGESEFVMCPKCGYAANIEAAKSLDSETLETEDEEPLEKINTFDNKTIEEVSDFLKVPRHKLAKSLVYKIDHKYVLAVIRGDDELNEVKLKNFFNAKSLELATDEEVLSIFKAHTGAIGPVNSPIETIVDKKVLKMKNFICGANEDGFHLKNVNLYRDFTPNYVEDIRVVKEGDFCPKCGTPLKKYNGIELGHTFKLGTKYSEKMNATFLDADGKEKHFIMGCYGIGVGRTLQAIIEKFHDDKGIIWPMNIAPFKVEILPINTSDEEINNASNRLHESLVKEGIEVLLDDRDDLSAGEKFNDADLIGIPLQVIVGRAFKKEGKFEIKIRKTGERKTMDFNEIVNFIKEAIKE